MQNVKYRLYLQILAISLLIAFVAMACTKEHISQCVSDTCKLTVKAYDIQGNELTHEIVKDATIYVFDRNREFLGVHTDIKIGESVEFNYPDNEHFTVVVWGNGMQGNQTMPTLNVGDKMEAAFVSLIQTKAVMAAIQSPDDLFHGMANLTKENQTVENSIPIYRKTSGVAITARHLKQHANASDENFTYVLRQTGDKLDFEGKEAGTFSCYKPQASFAGNQDEFIAPIFNILTTELDIEVDILHGDLHIATVTKASDGSPLRVEAGKVLNILIDFKNDITISVSVTPWGERQTWKEFN